MRKYLIAFMIFFTTGSLFSQVFNHGTITLENNAKLHIKKQYTNYGMGKINNSGIIDLGGNWENYAESNVFTENKGKVVFSGIEQFVLYNITTYGKLVLNENTETILNTDIAIGEELIFQNGIIDLNGYDLILNNESSTAISVFYGGLYSDNPDSKLIWNIANSNKYSIPFITLEGFAIPVNFEIISYGINPVEINTYATDSINQPLPPSIENLTLEGIDVSDKTVDRFWYINTGGSKLKTTFSFTDNDLSGNSINKEKLELLFYDGNKWVMDTTGHYNEGSENTYTATINNNTWFTLIEREMVNTFEQEKVQITDKLTVYPNPAGYEVFVKIPDYKQAFELELRDFSGKSMIKKNLKSNTGSYKFDISGLKNGIYLITLKQKDGKRYTGKFIRSF